MFQRFLGSILSYTNLGINILVNLLYVPIFLNLIGTSEFGIYQLVGSLIAYLSLMDFGITPATVRFYTAALTKGDVREQRTVLGFSLLLLLALTLLLCSAGGIVYTHLPSWFDNLTLQELASLQSVFAILLVNIAIHLPGNIFSAVLTAHEQFIFARGLLLVQSILRPITIIVCLTAWPYAATAAAVQMIFNIALVAIQGWYCLSRLHISCCFHLLPIDIRQNFFLLATSSFLVVIIDQLFWRTNQIILGLVSGTTEVAVYSIAYVIYISYMSFSGCISSVFFPQITKMVVQKEPIYVLFSLFLRIGRLQYMVLMLPLLGFLLLGKEFIALWAGKNFVGAYAIALAIMFPFTIDLIQNIGLGIMQAQNRYMYRAKVYLAVGLLNITLATPAAFRWGGIGCALATGFCMFLGNGLIMNYYYWKIQKLDIPRFWQEICNLTLAALPTAGIGIALNFCLPNYAISTLTIKIIVITVCYIISIYALGMNTYERGIINSVWGRVNKIFARTHLS